MANKLIECASCHEMIPEKSIQVWVHEYRDPKTDQLVEKRMHLCNCCFEVRAFHYHEQLAMDENPCGEYKGLLRGKRRW